MNCSDHTPLPDGYSARQARFIELMKTHKQVVCPGCGLWKIWVPQAQQQVPTSQPDLI